jgi:hypothetical protein
MTENQWPEDPAYTAPPASTGLPGERSAATFPSAATPQYGEGQTGDTSGASRKDAAKEEAADVARTAKGSAQNVAQTAKSEAANVASEAKSSAQDLLHQAKSGLTSQAGTQQQKAAEGIRTISSQLQSMADAPDQQGVASDLIRQAAKRSESVASWLENKQPGDLLGEVQRFARNKPGTFLLLAAGAGVLAGRLTRGLTAGAPNSQGAVQGAPAHRAVQPQPVAPLHQETVYAAGNDDLFTEPVVTGGAPVSTSTLPAGTAEDTPLRYEDDPYRDEDGSYRSTGGGYRSSEGRQL